ncbi:MAG TPA: hypothetical protein DEP53_03630 [Bacteroidetes bacterium]|nr:hypothetical protein [Bacteroidota bacterium]
MREKIDAPISRRRFFRLAAALAGTAAVAHSGLAAVDAGPARGFMPSVVVRLNPAFRIRNLSGNRVELFTHLPDGHVLAHHFAGCEADVLKTIENGATIADVKSAIAQLHGLSQADVDARIRTSLNELEQGRLIYYGDKMIVKIAETNGGH